jgi:hypothetical protein
MDLPSYPAGPSRPEPEERLVLLAFPQRFCNPLAMRVRDDFGRLDWQPGEIQLRGRQFYQFSSVIGLSLVRQTIPRLAILISNLLFLGMTFGGILRELTPSNPVTWGVLVVLNILLIWGAMSTKWIQITYLGRSGQKEVVYILPVNRLGWRQLFGGTEQLYSLLSEQVLVTDSASRS